jgi:hypothetical protein
MPKPLFETEGQWFDLIQECQTSGLTDRDFCRQRGISTTSMYRHIRKLKQNAYVIPELQHVKHEVVRIDNLAEDPNGINIPEAEKDISGLEMSYSRNSDPLHISCGKFHIDIDRTTDRGLLQDTLMILQKIC